MSVMVCKEGQEQARETASLYPPQVNGRGSPARGFPLDRPLEDPYFPKGDLQVGRGSLLPAPLPYPAVLSPRLFIREQG